MKPFLTASLVLATLLGAAQVSAKLPAPSDEAKAKAAEAAAKAAHNAKVDAFQLCKSMDKVAADYYAAAKKAGTETKPSVATPACADPGPFVYTPAAPAPAPAPVAAAAAPVAAAGAAPAPAAAAAPKK
jgi:hypothetical protein